MDELIRRDLREGHDPREVVSDPQARYFGAELGERTLLPRRRRHPRRNPLGRLVPPVPGLEDRRRRTTPPFTDGGAYRRNTKYTAPKNAEARPEVVVQPDRLAHVKHRERHEDDQCDHFLHDLELAEAQGRVADTIGRDLKQVLEECHAPARDSGDILRAKVMNTLDTTSSPVLCSRTRGLIGHLRNWTLVWRSGKEPAGTTPGTRKSNS